MGHSLVSFSFQMLKELVIEICVFLPLVLVAYLIKLNAEKLSIQKLIYND